MPRRVRPTLCLLACAAALLAAEAPAAEKPDDVIRRANAAFLSGDRDEADRLYAAAEELTGDPGLVAFNRATVLFQHGEFREAEVRYARALDDAACPADRATRAWYNRGTCLLRRAKSAPEFRSAIACLERCLDSDAADEPLKADARHNLELAKQLWNEARKTDAKPDKPNEDPPPEDPRSDPPPPKPIGTEEQPGVPEQGDGKNGPHAPKTVPQANPMAAPMTDPNGAQAPTHGNGSAPQLKDEAEVQQLSPEDTRRHLAENAARIRRDRRALLESLAPKAIAGTREW